MSVQLLRRERGWASHIEMILGPCTNRQVHVLKVCRTFYLGSRSRFAISIFFQMVVLERAVCLTPNC